jgi:hypothetical protein
MKYIILSFLIIAALQAGAQKKAGRATKGKNTIGLYPAAQKHFNLIDSLRWKDVEGLEAENEKLIQTIARHRAEIFNLDDAHDFDLLYIAKSPDNKFSLVSWDTRMGGTMIIFATMAIFKTADGTINYKMLTDSIETGIEHSLMRYDTLYSINTAKGNLYLAQGRGQGSTVLPWQELRAFRIENNQLVNPVVFPDKKYKLFVEFDTHQFSDRDKIPTIKIRESGKTILLPIPTEQEGFSGKYQTLVFSGFVYKVK